MRDRSTFGYLEPVGGDQPEFAQCGTCTLWIKGNKRCFWLMPNDEVEEGDSCIYYVQGEPTGDDVEPIGAFTKKELGFVRGEVRCENCVSFEHKASACELFRILNRLLPTTFALDARVKPQACCNAFDSDKVEKMY